MKAILRGIGIKFAETYRSDEWSTFPEIKFGLVRVQWGGDWTRPGVPMKARYRKTHWVAIKGGFIFDVNAAQWLQHEVWDQKLVPWLCEECVPGWDGLYWPTHVIEVEAPKLPL